MRARGTGSKWLILCSFLAMGTILGTSGAQAGHRYHKIVHHHHYHARVVSISCVPYAREISGIEVSGNAWEWWDNAAGLYARGHVPQAGSVLNFEANRRMRLGHVAVVSRVISRREIEVDQANWPHGGIERGVPVVDVSRNNDWSAVRVELGHSGDFGSIYPTYGFIYPRRDNGVMLAASTTAAPRLMLGTAPVDLRQVDDNTEIAEAPAGSRSVRHRGAHRIVHRSLHSRGHARMEATAHQGTRLRT